MQKRVSLILASLIILSSIILLAKNTVIVSFFESVVQTVFLPSKIIFTSKVENEDTLSKLKKENIKLAEKFVEIEVIKKDNQALRSQFQETVISTSDLIPARVIGYVGAYSHPNVLVIDKGKYDGVRKGSVVVFGKNLVGKIGDVSPKYSSVILPYNNEFTTVGKTLKGAEGVVSGLDNFILLDKVVIEENLSKGDVVLTRGDVNSVGVGIYPDIIVGKIDSIEKVETRPFQNAKIESLLNFTKLNMVFVRM